MRPREWLTVVSILAAVLVTTPAVAQEDLQKNAAAELSTAVKAAPAPDVPPAWKGGAELAYIQTQGNTNTKSLTFGTKVERAFGFGKLTGEGSAIYGEKEKVVTDRAYTARLRYDQNLTDRTSLFVSEGIERNTFKGIDFRYTTLGGIAHTFIQTPNDLLKGDVGAGYMHENQVKPQPARGHPTARVGAEYQHIFDPKNRFVQTAEYIPNLKQGDDFLFNEESALITNLMGGFALKVSYAVFHDHDPPAGFKKTDALFKTALLFTF